ncbi:MAG TPA: MFS transporter [Candidatus Saccharimonadales bacterium]|nr:MFS transporter [Candidatus Saccharimonadales bacterium]
MTEAPRERADRRWLGWVTPDGRRLLLARVLRTFAYGYLSVVLGVYLDRLGLDPTRIGIVLTAAIAGSAVMTVGWSLFADRYGRRRTISTMAVLMVIGGLAFAFADSFAVLILAGFTGTISATNSEVGVFQTVDQAMLPQTAPDARRTWLFAVYNTLATFGGALGALFAASVGAFERLGLSGPDAYRPLFVLYAIVGLANLALFAGLTDKLELAKVHGERRFFGIHRSRGIVARLAALFGLDAFAGALVVQSLVAYWFFIRWGLDPTALAVLFFAVNLLSGLSLLAAGWLASRFGLLNTMVFTHLPSNVLLVLVPLMPSPALAVAVFLLRMSISQMDVPTRQSYTMAVVDPDERTATAGLTNVARTAASAVSPLVTGVAFAAGSLALPFVLAGALKIAYDGLVYVTFRGVRPPEEERPSP